MNDATCTFQPCSSQPSSQESHQSAESSQPFAPATGKEARTKSLFLCYQATGDPHLKEAIFEEWKKAVKNWAAHYKSPDACYDDLYQEGCIGLIVAIDRFDLHRNVQFSTFATYHIRGAMREYCRKRTWCCYVPRRYKDAAVKITRLSRDMGREPTRQEVGQLLELSGDKLDAALFAMRVRRPSLVFCGMPREATRDRLDEGQAREPADPTDSESDQVIWRLYVDDLLHKALSPKEEAIVRMYYFEELSQREIAEKTGTYQMAVSRSLHDSLGKLRKEIRRRDDCIAS